MAPFTGVPTQQQQIVLAVMPKVSASLSILGSSYIVYDCIFRGQRHKREQTSYHRLLVGLSICDLLMSIGLFTSTWPMPADTPNVWGAVGNVQTCEAVGFIEQAGVAAVMYNASMSTYYLLRIRYGWTPRKIAKVEPFMHAIPLLFGLATMIASLTLDLFNSGLFDCWIAPFPQGCEESWRNGGVTTCERGDNASLYQWLFDLIPKWSSVLLVTFNMFRTHRAVLQRERSMHRFTRPSSNEPSSNESSIRPPEGSPKPRVARMLARQSYLYVGALYLTYIPVIITRLTELISGSVYYGMLLTISITIPLQGFWNGMCRRALNIHNVLSCPCLTMTADCTFYDTTAIVYLRPRYLRARGEQRKEATRQQRLNTSVAHSKPPVIFLQFQAISEAVVEGGLSDEEEDTGNEEDGDVSDCDDVYKLDAQDKEMDQRMDDAARRQGSVTAVELLHSRVD